MSFLTLMLLGAKMGTSTIAVYHTELQNVYVTESIVGQAIVEESERLRVFPGGNIHAKSENEATIEDFFKILNTIKIEAKQLDK